MDGASPPFDPTVDLPPTQPIEAPTPTGSSIKIVTFNVNGLRAFLRRKYGEKATIVHFLTDFGADIDILCLQETKLRRAELTSSPELALCDGWESFFSCAASTRGYSGTATFCRKNTALPFAAEEGFSGGFAPPTAPQTTNPSTTSSDPCLVQMHLSLEGHYTEDELKELDSEGRIVITDHGNFVLFNIYAPAITSAETAENRMEFKMKFFKALQLRWEDFLFRQNKPVIVVGDINVAPSPLDYPDYDPDFYRSSRPDRAWLYTLLHGEQAPVPPPSTSITNSEASNHEQKGSACGLFEDVFRCINPVRRSAYTVWSTATNARVNNYGSRIDLVLTAGLPILTKDGIKQREQTNAENQKLEGKKIWTLLDAKKKVCITGCDIQPEVQGSDHCPVWLTLQYPQNTTKSNTRELYCANIPPVCAMSYAYSGKQTKLHHYWFKRGENSTEQPELPAYNDDDDDNNNDRTQMTNVIQQQQEAFEATAYKDDKNTTTTTKDEDGSMDVPLAKTTTTTAKPPPGPSMLGQKRGGKPLVKQAPIKSFFRGGTSGSIAATEESNATTAVTIETLDKAAAAVQGESVGFGGGSILGATAAFIEQEAAAVEAMRLQNHQAAKQAWGGIMKKMQTVPSCFHGEPAAKKRVNKSGANHDMEATPPATKPAKNSLASWPPSGDISKSLNNKNALNLSEVGTLNHQSTQPTSPYGATPPVNDTPVLPGRGPASSLGISRPSSSAGISDTSERVMAHIHNNNNNTPPPAPSSTGGNSTPQSALSVQLQTIAAGGDPDLDSTLIEGEEETDSEYDTPRSLEGGDSGVLIGEKTEEENQAPTSISSATFNNIDAAQQGFLSGSVTPASPQSPSLPSSFTAAPTTTQPQQPPASHTAKRPPPLKIPTEMPPPPPLPSTSSVPPFHQPAAVFAVQPTPTMASFQQPTPHHYPAHASYPSPRQQQTHHHGAPQYHHQQHYASYGAVPVTFASYYPASALASSTPGAGGGQGQPQTPAGFAGFVAPGGVGDPSSINAVATAPTPGFSHHAHFYVPVPFPTPTTGGNTHSGSSRGGSGGPTTPEYQAQYHEMLAYMQGFALQYPHVAALPSPSIASHHHHHGGYSTGGHHHQHHSYSNTGSEYGSDGGYTSHQYAASQRPSRQYQQRSSGEYRRSYGSTGTNNTNIDHQQHSSAAVPQNSASNTPPANVPRSPLLDDFKGWREIYGDEYSTGRNYWNLPNLSGHLYAFCRDQHGSRLVQYLLSEAELSEVKAAFEELKPWLTPLMTDVFANYVIQRFLEVQDPAIVSSIANTMHGRVLQLSLHTYGCRVVQKALEVMEADQRIALCAEELQGHTLRCIQDQNGNHVIQKCIETIQPSDPLAPMLRVIHENAIQLAMHSFGCRLVQRLLEYCTIEELVERTVADVLSSVLMLAHDQYGNYVIQHLVIKGPEVAKVTIFGCIAPQAATMSQHKYASNVVEGCLKHGTPSQRAAIINHLLSASDNSSPTNQQPKSPRSSPRNTTASGSSGSPRGAAVVPDQGTRFNPPLTVDALARHKFGNYVIQRALQVAEEPQKGRLIAQLKSHIDSLRKYPHGKHVAQLVENLVEEQQEI